MKQPLQVEFEIVAKDFQNGVQQLLVNHEEFEDTDVAEIRVGNLIGLSTIGSETSVDGRGKLFGDACLPLSVLEKLATLAVQGRANPVVTISIKDGETTVEKSTIKHRGITVGERASSPAAIPVNASSMDILATAEVMPKSDISAAGLKARLTKAIEERDAAVDSAFETLRNFGVQKEEVFELVQKHIEEMAEGMKKALGKRRGLHTV